MNINYEFTPIESEWISIPVLSDHEYPTIDFVVLVAEKLIGKQACYDLKIKKVKSLYGHRFMAAVWSNGGGSGCNSELFLNYDDCLEKGMTLIQKMYDDFKSEMSKFLK